MRVLVYLNVRLTPLTYPSKRDMSEALDVQFSSRSSHRNSSPSLTARGGLPLFFIFQGWLYTCFRPLAENRCTTTLSNFSSPQAREGG